MTSLTALRLLELKTLASARDLFISSSIRYRSLALALCLVAGGIVPLLASHPTPTEAVLWCGDSLLSS
ncbi:MAG: hypothetical protein WBB29_03605 [Geitlerinemataceae cyanobacterium]